MSLFKIILASLLLFANSAYSMTSSQAFSVCYAEMSKYSHPDFTPYCADTGSGYRVALTAYTAQFGWYMTNAGNWDYDNRNTAACNQSVINVDTDVNLTSVGSATASRGGSAKKPVDFKKLAGVVAGGAIAGAAVGGGLPGALVGGLMSLGATALEAYLEKPTQITQNCNIQIVNNDTVNNSVSTADPTITQIQQSLELMDAVQFQQFLQQLDDKQFSCVTGGSCDGVPMATDGTGTGTGTDSGTGTGTGIDSGTDSGTGTGTTVVNIDLSKVEKNTGDTAKALEATAPNLQQCSLTECCALDINQTTARIKASFAKLNTLIDKPKIDYVAASKCPVNFVDSFEGIKVDVNSGFCLAIESSREAFKITALISALISAYFIIKSA